MRYNFVLVPNSEETNLALITLAKEASSNKGLTPNYLLKDQEKLSIPHISVLQFEIKEDSLSSKMFTLDKKQYLESLWKLALDAWQETLVENENAHAFLCNSSSTINYKHDTVGPLAGISWAEILINKTENPLVQLFHDKLREKLNLIGVTCLNASVQQYNPHITLFNIQSDLLKQVTPLQEIPETYRSALSYFSVSPALGTANANWELTAKLFMRGNSIWQFQKCF